MTETVCVGPFVLYIYIYIWREREREREWRGQGRGQAQDRYYVYHLVLQAAMCLFCLVDSDPCRESRQVCSPYADCVPERGSYRCLCKEGYTGDGLRCQGNRIYTGINQLKDKVFVIIQYHLTAQQGGKHNRQQHSIA